MARLARKDDQTETLRVLTDYCREIRRRAALGETRTEEAAFHAIRHDNDYTASGVEGVPYPVSACSCGRAHRRRVHYHKQLPPTGGSAVFRRAPLRGFTFGY
jgi:hypothetical protein